MAWRRSSLISVFVAVTAVSFWGCSSSPTKEPICGSNKEAKCNSDAQCTWGPDCLKDTALLDTTEQCENLGGELITKKVYECSYKCSRYKTEERCLDEKNTPQGPCVYNATGPQSNQDVVCYPNSTAFSACQTSVQTFEPENTQSSQYEACNFDAGCYFRDTGTTKEDCTGYAAWDCLPTVYEGDTICVVYSLNVTKQYPVSSADDFNDAMCAVSTTNEICQYALPFDDPPNTTQSLRQ